MQRFRYVTLSVSCLVLCLAGVLPVAAGSVSGDIVMSGYNKADGYGALFIEGFLHGCDAALLYEKETGDLLVSFGPMAPPGSFGHHVYCDLKDFSVEIPNLSNMSSTGVVMDAMVKGAKQQPEFDRLGIWSWSTGGEFELYIVFSEKATGCFTDAMCGANRIFGPFCDPCEYTLCCYEDYGYIKCGNLLCW